MIEIEAGGYAPNNGGGNYDPSKTFKPNSREKARDAAILHGGRGEEPVWISFDMARLVPSPPTKITPELQLSTLRTALDAIVKHGLRPDLVEAGKHALEISGGLKA